MKPGNLLIQGAKSDGKRKMRIRYYAHRVPDVRFFYNGLGLQMAFLMVADFLSIRKILL